jgi:hypothetical protein
MNKQKGYDSTVARIAGNIMSGAFTVPYLASIGRHGLDQIHTDNSDACRGAVAIAREIVAETKRTEPTPQEDA